jgi:hypothetical protein
MEEQQRSFTVYGSNVNFKGGRYISLMPSSAAKKAASRIFREYPKKSVVVLTLRETTAGSNHDNYSYKATKVNLKKPVVVMIGSKKIEYTFKIDIKAVEVEKSHHTSVNKSKGGIALIEDSFKNIFKQDSFNEKKNLSNVKNSIMKGGGSCNNNYCTI